MRYLAELLPFGCRVMTHDFVSYRRKWKIYTDTLSWCWNWVSV